MPVKVNCQCGVSCLVLEKNPGEYIICKNCGKKNPISEYSKLKQLESEMDDPDATVCLEDESGFEKINISKVVSELNEDKKVIRDKIKREAHLNKDDDSSNKPQLSKKLVPQIEKHGRSKKLKCLACGELCKLDAKVCLSCGCNPKTGKTYVPPPTEKSKNKSSSFPIGKFFAILFAAIILIILLIVFLIFLPTIKKQLNVSEIKKELNIEDEKTTNPSSEKNNK